MVRTDQTAATGGLSHDLRADLQRLSSRFFADAPAVDTAESVPDDHLRSLANARLYGLFAPETEGGLGLGYPGMCSAVEELASGCLASTFLWSQHFRFLGAMLGPGRTRPTARRHWPRASPTRNVCGAAASPTSLTLRRLLVAVSLSRSTVARTAPWDPAIRPPEQPTRPAGPFCPPRPRLPRCLPRSWPLK